MTVWNGTLPTILGGDVPSGADWLEILNAIHGLTNAWTTYTPVWTGTTTNPGLSNASVTSAYLRSGKFVTYVGSITMGTTTTYGSGAYLLSVPEPLLSASLATGFIYLQDASTPANDRIGVVVGSTASTLVPLTSGGNVTPSNPFTWANVDRMAWSITYEAA